MCLSHHSAFAQTKGAENKLKTIVIDPGHGGKDPGAIGKFSKEKDITLAVALELGSLVKSELKDVKVIFTRKEDEFIELFERANIANKNKADLFISIHINSSKNKEASGAEAWVLGLHRTNENLEVAKRENEVIQLEGNVQENYGLDPNSPVGNIMMTMKQNAFLNQSILFAKKVEGQFAEKMNRRNRGVHQAGFAVLYKTVMPSCLIELGFISNKEEEQYLNSRQGRTEIATSILIALKKFKAEYEGQKTDGKKNNEEEQDDSEEPEPKEIKEPVKIKEPDKSKTKSEENHRAIQAEENNKASRKDESRKSNQKENIEASPKKVEKNSETGDGIVKYEPKTESKEKPEEKLIEEVNWNGSYVKVDDKNKGIKENYSAQRDKKTVKSKEQEGKIYRVQLMARPFILEKDHPIFNLYNDIEVVQEQVNYKYLTGKFTQIEEAIKRKEDAQKKGYPDAFIGIYEGTKRVGIKF